MVEKLNLKKDYRANSTLFAGRREGESVRKDLDLDKKDRDDNTYLIILPEDTTSINSSFFLGLFYKSIQYLGSLEKFDSKYSIDYSNIDDVRRAILEQDVSDDKRKANNVLNKKTILG